MIARSIAVGIAVILIAVNCTIVVIGAAQPLSFVIIDALISAGIVVAMCIVDMPTKYRVLLILLVVISLLFAARQSDLFLTTDTADHLEAVTETGAASPAQSANPAAGGAPSSGGRVGASIHLVGQEPGDAAWAHRLSAELDRTLGGPAASAIHIEGNTATAKVGEGRGITVTWGVAFRTDKVACGHSTTIGANDALLVAQIKEQFEAAIARTLASGVASCP